MHSRRSLSQFALTVLLTTPIFLQKGYANALSLVAIVSFPLTAVAHNSTIAEEN